ncbi:hypothetical protein EDD86DRAFT_247008 [Gorgonomyces haynaldii]|nr:hypothetical protein EDD86DRAFT_247008 [Gorgonomyces haynaldii]
MEQLVMAVQTRLTQVSRETIGQIRINDHINKFYDPPTYQKKTFHPYDLFLIVQECGATNISFRIKEWLRFHHIDAFFDYLMGLPNEFYQDPKIADSGYVTPTERLERRYPDAVKQEQEQALLPPISTISRPSSPRLQGWGSDPRRFALDDSRKRPREEEDQKLGYSRSPSPQSSVEQELPQTHEQLVSLVHALRSELHETKRIVHRYRDQIAQRDAHIQALGQDIDQKNRTLQRVAQLKMSLLRDVEQLL